jgi:hypothetical protein
VKSKTTILATAGMLCLVSSSAFAQLTPNWSRGFLVPEGGRANPYQVPPDQLQQSIDQGKIHTQVYPVSVTGLLPPYRPVKSFIEEKADSPFAFLMKRVFRGFTHMNSFDDVLQWIGLHEYPESTDEGIYSVPVPKDHLPEKRMGFGTIDRNGAEGFTLSCAACHSSRLFGKTVLGLSNRFPRANETFVKAKFFAHFLSPDSFQKVNHATDAEADLLRELKENVRAVGAVKPLVMGLDTSLAQVALSLNRRNPDAFATKNRKFEKRPRPDLLETLPADSKPAVWWNLKYKNRWLSDGSVISGNPVFTNILWNEIGRGVDLQKLDQWLYENDQVIQELTSAVFSVEAPRITDFFPAERVDLNQARYGETIFNQTCSRCHGVYDKAWNQAGSENLALADQLRTTAVRYPQKTFVVDVGTDPNRYLGMKSLEKLNDLAISKRNNTVIQAQKGYVPPPLVGIWARWPYFHNNSAPSLCAVLTAADKRPKKYYAGNANNPETDFDLHCNGYPLGENTPEAWKKKAFKYDTRKEGLRNSGHDEGIFLKNGQEILSSEQKLALIQFLQTL